MATLFEWDGGALPSIVGTTPTVDGHSMIFATGSADNVAQWPISADQFTLRWYFKVPSAWAAAAWSMMIARASSASNARFNIAGSASPGQIRHIRAGNTEILRASNIVSLSTEYRVEIQIDRINQTYRGAVFPLMSETPIHDTGLLTSIDTGAATFTNIWLGHVTGGNSLNELTIGRIKAVDTIGSWIGRHASDIAADPDTIIEWDDGNLPEITGATPTLDGDNFMVIAGGDTLNYASWFSTADTFAARFYIKTPSTWGSVSSKIFTVGTMDTPSIDQIIMAGVGSPGRSNQSDLSRCGILAGIRLANLRYWFSDG